MNEIDLAGSPAIVAIITGVFALIGILIQQRRTHRKLGDPDGSITKMLSTLLQGQTGQDVRLAQLENRTLELQTSQAETDAVLDAHEERIIRVERQIDRHLTDHTEITQLGRSRE